MLKYTFVVKQVILSQLLSVAIYLIMKLLYFLIILLECHFIMSDNVDYSKDFKQFLKYQQEDYDYQKIILETQLDALDNQQKLIESQQSLLTAFMEYLDKQQGLVQPSVLTQKESTTIDHPGQFLWHIFKEVFFSIFIMYFSDERLQWFTRFSQV